MCHRAFDARYARFCFVAANVGTRPGKDVLVTIRATGDLQLVQPELDDDESEDEKSNARIRWPRLPKPPTIPSGRRIVGLGLEAVKTMEELERSIGFARSTGFVQPLLPDLPDLLRSPNHDPNAFYWRRGRPSGPSAEFQFECHQWRHGLEPQLFDGEISFDDELDEVKGALECRIHAENLSDVVALTVPVKLNIKRASTYDRAKAMVDELASR